MKILQIEVLWDLLGNLYSITVMLAPIFGTMSFLALIVGWIVSPRFRLWLLSLSKRFDKTRIGEQCAVFMGPRIKSLNEENPEAFMPLVKLEFTKKPFEVAKLDPNDNVIIVLKDANDKAENLLRITERYVSKGVMPRGRRLVDSKTKRAVEVTLMFRLLSNVDEALKLWDREHYQPCLEKPETRETLEVVHYVDRHGGYLTRMFLPQLELIALREGPVIRPVLVEETNAWLSNIYKIALKHHDDPDIYEKEEGELTFIQDNFGVQVVLVARSALVRNSGIKPHKRRVLMALANPSIQFVYIIGMGETNCFHSVRLVGETYLDPRIASIWPAFYRTRSRGKDHSPMVLVRYTKGPLPDVHNKKRRFNSFQKMVRKELKKVRVTSALLDEWIQKNGQLYLGNDSQLSRNDAVAISKTMNDEDMTMDVLPYLFENEECNLRHEEFLRKRNIDSLSSKDSILYRIHVLLDRDDSEIIPFLDPRIFMK